MIDPFLALWDLFDVEVGVHYVCCAAALMQFRVNTELFAVTVTHLFLVSPICVCSIYFFFFSLRFMGVYRSCGQFLF